MKLKAIEIVGFGKWQHYKIEFSQGNQLVDGNNEAGKSTVYQFIQAMFFGFPTKGKKKKDYTPKNGGAYGGYLWFDHPIYGEVKIERFKEKNKGQAKLYYNQQIGDEKLLEKILHPVTKELAQSVYTFQQEQLTDLENLEEEKLQKSLLSLGVTGSPQLLTIREEYFKKAQAIYKGKGSQPSLNQKLLTYQELQQKIYNKEKQEASFQQVEKQLLAVQQEIFEKQNQMRADEKKKHLLEKRQMNFPLYEELQQLNKEQPSKILISVNHTDQKKLEAAYQQHQFLNEELARLSYEIATRSEDNEQTEHFNFYLREESTIQTLLNRRYEIEKQLVEIEWMEQTVQQNQQEMKQLENRWHWNSQTPPHLLFDEKELQRIREKEVAQAVQLQNAETNIQMIQKDIEIREENLSTFELVNKDMFSKTVKNKGKRIQTIWCIIGIFLLLTGFFLPVPFKYIVMGLGVVVSILGIAPLIYQPKDTYENEKKQWQEKLSQLDYLNEQLMAAKNQLAHIKVLEQTAKEEIQKNVEENNLGKMDRIDLWLNHRNDVTRYLLLLNTNKELLNQINENQEQLKEVKELTEHFFAWLPISRKPLKERIETIHHFADQMEKIKFAQEYQADAYTKQGIRELKEKHHDLLNDIQPLLEQYKIKAIDEIPIQLQAYQTSWKQTNRYEEITAMLGNLYEEETNVEQLIKQQKDLANKMSKDTSHLQELQSKEQELLYQKQKMLSDGTLDELYQEQAGLKAEIEELALEWSGYWLAGQLLMDLLTELSEKQLPSLLLKATEYFRLLTKESYKEIQMVDSILIFIDATGQRFMIQELSTGTRDQLLMAVRFAFLYLQGSTMLYPVIVDDGWLHYDQQRKYNLAKLFERFGETHQIICFSSDQEMVNYYKELNQKIIHLEEDKNEKTS